LLNSLTIFLPPNSLSSREKEPIPLDGNTISKITREKWTYTFVYPFHHCSFTYQ
jgi:hypothetical protein